MSYSCRRFYLGPVDEETHTQYYWLTQWVKAEKELLCHCYCNKLITGLEKILQVLHRALYVCFLSLFVHFVNIAVQGEMSVAMNSQTEVM